MAAQILGALALFFFCACLATLGVWWAAGSHFVTQYQVAETVIEEDEFGDAIERTEMRDEFRFGLMPDRGYDGAAPIALFFLLAAGGCGGMGWRQLGKQARAKAGHGNPENA